MKPDAGPAVSACDRAGECRRDPECPMFAGQAESSCRHDEPVLVEMIADRFGAVERQWYCDPPAGLFAVAECVWLDGEPPVQQVLAVEVVDVERAGLEDEPPGWDVLRLPDSPEAFTPLSVWGGGLSRPS